MENTRKEGLWRELGEEDDEFAFGYIEYEHVWDIQVFSQMCLDVWA